MATDCVFVPAEAFLPAHVGDVAYDILTSSRVRALAQIDYDAWQTETKARMCFNASQPEHIHDSVGESYSQECMHMPAPVITSETQQVTDTTIDDGVETQQDVDNATISECQTQALAVVDSSDDTLIVSDDGSKNETPSYVVSAPVADTVPPEDRISLDLKLASHEEEHKIELDDVQQTDTKPKRASRRGRKKV